MSPKKKSSKSLLTRFFKSNGKKKGKKGSKTKTGKRKSETGKGDVEDSNVAKTPRQKSIAEIKQMRQVGDKSPERLARILSTILSQERQKNEKDQEMFDQMVWGIIQRKEKGQHSDSDEGEDADDGSDNGTAEREDV